MFSYPAMTGGLVTKSCPTLVTPWTIAHLAPLSMGFPRQEYWSRLLFPSPGDLLKLGVKRMCTCIAGSLLHCRQILYHRATREANNQAIPLLGIYPIEMKTRSQKAFT